MVMPMTMMSAKKPAALIYGVPIMDQARGAVEQSQLADITSAFGRKRRGYGNKDRAQSLNCTLALYVHVLASQTTTCTAHGTPSGSQAHAICRSTFVTMSAESLKVVLAATSLLQYIPFF